MHALALEAQPRSLLGVLGCLAESRVVGQRIRLAAFLAPHEIDCSPMDERQDPRACFRALRPEGRRTAPDLEERLLDCILGVSLVSQNAQREAVGDARDAVVELGERFFVGPRNERYQSFVREMSVVFPHGKAVRRPSQR